MSTIREEIRALSATTKDLRSFGLTVGAALVVFWIVLWKVFPFVFGRGGNFPWLAYIGVALAAVGAVAPVVLKPVFYGWMSLAFVLSFVMTRVILTIFFFVVLTPVGLFFRLIGRDALHRKMDRQGSTYWIDKEYPIADRSRYEKFF